MKRKTIPIGLLQRQDNVLPHHAMKNSGLFQGRLLQAGSGKTPVQRLGKAIIGFFFMFLGSLAGSAVISDFLGHNSINLFGLFVALLFVILAIPLGVKLNLDAAFPSPKEKRKR